LKIRFETAEQRLAQARSSRKRAESGEKTIVQIKNAA
jgi:hypothetical protein